MEVSLRAGENGSTRGDDGGIQMRRSEQIGTSDICVRCRGAGTAFSKRARKAHKRLPMEDRGGEYQCGVESSS